MVLPDEAICGEMSHLPSEAAGGSAMFKRDRKSSEEARAARLQEAWPILGGQCPEGLLRLWRYYDERLTTDKVDQEGLQQAAEQVLTCVQRELQGRPSPLDLPAAGELWRARHFAIDALIFQRDNKHAKETERRLVAPDLPLAICIGSRKRRKIKTRAGQLEIGALGCLSTFPDTARSAGQMWPEWCPNCRSTARKPLRDQERAIIRDVKKWRSGKVNPRYEWLEVALRPGKSEDA
jgi:hypothetical protein